MAIEPTGEAVASTNSAMSIALDVSAMGAEGDVMVVHVFWHRKDDVTGPVKTTGGADDGWTFIRTDHNGAAHPLGDNAKMSCWYKVRGATQDSITWNLGGATATALIAGGLSFSGVDTSDVINGDSGWQLSPGSPNTTFIATGSPNDVPDLVDYAVEIPEVADIRRIGQLVALNQAAGPLRHVEAVVAARWPSGSPHTFSFDDWHSSYVPPSDYWWGNAGNTTLNAMGVQFPEPEFGSAIPKGVEQATFCHTLAPR